MPLSMQRSTTNYTFSGPFPDGVIQVLPFVYIPVIMNLFIVVFIHTVYPNLRGIEHGHILSR
jgi:hypothetical protein